MNKDSSSIGLNISEKMGIALKHAGVSVTVTSLTDVFAFGVGAVTVRINISAMVYTYLLHYRECLNWSHFVCAQLLYLAQYTYCKYLGL